MNRFIVYIACLCCLILGLIVGSNRHDRIVELVPDTVFVTDMNYSACLDMIGALR